MTNDTKGHILFVDEDTDICDMMCTLLDRAGYQAVAVSSISEGFQYAKNRNFDLILLDWFLEDGTGIDLCKRIRHIDEQTPIFFYTGVAYPQELKKALEAGAQGYFIKPVDTAMLMQTMEKQIQQSKSRDNIEPMARLDD
jgi:OmpR-family two-component system manganese-sensing response regulator